MDVSYDDNKNANNIAERGLSFELEWETALVVEDLRKDYGERRFQVIGYIEERLHVRVFTPRAGGIHVITNARYDAMRHKPDPERIDEENPELTDADFARARPAGDVLTELFGAEAATEAQKRRGRPPKDDPKQPVNIRLSPEVVRHFKASGRGWQTRIDDALKEWIKRH